MIEPGRRFARNRLATVGLVIVLGVALVALLADLISPHSPYRQQVSLRLKPPLFVDSRTGQTMLLGTDYLGRDVLSRLIYGSRTSLVVAIPAVIGSTFLGLWLGLVAGWYRGWIESVVLRIVDLQLAFPFILLALSVVALLGPSLRNIVMVFALTAWPRFARSVYASVLSLREREFVESARSLGARDLRILARHVAPNLMSSVLVLASFEVARMIILEASLGFLGLSVQAPTPTWGNMLADGRDYLRNAWWIAAFPGLAITVTAAGVNFLGDGLRDLLDPTLQID